MQKLIIAAIAAASSVIPAAAQTSWANYQRYAAANDTITRAPEVVFMGNSITEGWANQHPEFFTDNNFAPRGISGQVTSQMLGRFRADVIDLKPKAVVILGGVNDIALNQGPIEQRHIVENLISMCELAKANGIKPYLCSATPADTILWRPEINNTAGRIIELNKAIKQYAESAGVEYVDYHSALTREDGGMKRELTNDGLHPTRPGYDIMEPIILKALAPTLACGKNAKCCKKEKSDKDDKCVVKQKVHKEKVVKQK